MVFWAAWAGQCLGSVRPSAIGMPRNSVGPVRAQTVTLGTRGSTPESSSWRGLWHWQIHTRQPGGSCQNQARQPWLLRKRLIRSQRRKRASPRPALLSALQLPGAKAVTRLRFAPLTRRCDRLQPATLRNQSASRKSAPSDRSCLCISPTAQVMFPFCAFGKFRLIRPWHGNERDASIVHITDQHGFKTWPRFSGRARQRRISD